MSRDEHGMPIPSKLTVLPVRIADMMSECDRYSHGEVVIDSSENESEVVGLYAFGSREDMEFFVHAANWIIPCREIVRGLAELGSIGDRALMYQLVTDAANLWAKMQKEAGDE